MQRDRRTQDITTQAELAAELGLARGDDLVERLMALGITPETAPAFESLPLVEVAWADGNVDDEERWRVLGHATAFGLELGRPAHDRLESWLEEPPASGLFEGWYAFAERSLAAPRAARRADRVLDAVREVAEANGGWLGWWPASAPERRALTRIHRALGREPAWRS